MMDNVAPGITVSVAETVAPPLAGIELVLELLPPPPMASTEMLVTPAGISQV